MSDRLMYRLQYRNLGSHESLVVNHTVDVDGLDHAGIRWYEIRSPGSSPFIYQQGTYAPDADHRWMGSIAMDHAGNMALGFSVSGATTSPSIRYTGRLDGDEPGVMTQGEADLMVGAGSQLHDSGRWGDYSLLAIDPVDQCTFWYTQQYYAASSDADWRTRVGSFAFPGCVSSAPPDLPEVTISAPTARATEAGPTNGVFTIARTGDLTAPLDVHVTVAGTAAPGVDYVALPSFVTLGPGQAAATLAVVPLDDLAFEPDETVSLTLNPDPSYRGGWPSSAVITIVSDDVPPDLVVTSVVGPDVSGAGATFMVTDVTRNQGGGPSDASTTNLYLSTNAVFDAGDILVGTRAIPALAPGGSSTGSAPVTIPAGIASGIYYIVAKADGPDAIPETQEANNTRQSAWLRLGPDLTISAVGTTTMAGAGETVTVSDTTSNQGGGAASASRTALYLTTNGFINASSVVLGSHDVPSLAAGASATVSTSLVLPSGLAPGLYYIVASADQLNTVVESQETNNLRTSGAINIGPDLATSGVSAPAVAGAGSSLAITETTKNQGGGSTVSPTTTAFYLSADTALGPGDIALGGRPVPVLSAGTADAATTFVVLPSDIPAGAYYVLVKADANNQVAETYETNNVGMAYIRIGPDLTVTAPWITGSATSGASITVTDTAKNTGGGAAAASTTRFYLSTNVYYDAGDILVGSIDVPALAAGASSTGTTTCTVPIGTAPGTWYLIAVADGANVVAETSEANNAGITYLRIN
jgi:subtilase family serine protease